MATSVPAWLTEVVGPVAGAVRLPWGFHNESWLVPLQGGRRVAITRLVDAAPDPARIRAVTARLAAAGLPVPRPVAWPSTLPPNVVMTDWIDGEPGAAMLARPGGPELVGRLSGSTWRRLASVETTGLDLPSAWADPADLTGAALAWAARLDVGDDGIGIDGAGRAAIDRSIGALEGLLGGRAPAFVHGDLVPVNLLIRDGHLAALLDVEAARIADPLIDAAWFRWIVGYHHPAVEPVAWRAFTAAAGFDDLAAPVAELLRVLPLVRILDFLDRSERGRAARSSWAAHLRAWVRSAA